MAAISDSKARADLFQTMKIIAKALVLESSLVQEGIMIITRSLETRLNTI